MNKQEKAIVRLSKIAYKEMKKARPSLAGGNLNDVDDTIITNGCWMFVEENKDDTELEGFIKSQERILLNFKQFIKEQTKTSLQVNIDLKTRFKTYTTEMFDEKTEIVKIGDDWYNLKQVNMLLNCFVKPDIYAEYMYSSSNARALYIKEDNKIAVILPLHPNAIKKWEQQKKRIERLNYIE